MKKAYLFVIGFLILLIAATVVAYIITGERLSKCAKTESVFCPKYVCPGETDAKLSSS